MQYDKIYICLVTITLLCLENKFIWGVIHLVLCTIALHCQFVSCILFWPVGYSMGRLSGTASSGFLAQILFCELPFVCNKFEYYNLCPVRL